MDEEEEKKRSEKAILKELQLLEKMRKEHEWIVVGQKEAEEEEEAESKIDLETSDSTRNKPEGG